MKGDFSRWTFRPQQHYHAVLKQQGRVDLDSDWNEQDAIVAHRVESEALDVIGASGAPQGDAGFMIQVASSGSGTNNDLSVSVGRAYVDGILCENEQNNLLIDNQLDLPGYKLPTGAANAGLYVAYLEVWERHITYLDDGEIREVALGGPDTCTRARTIWQVKVVQAGAVGSGVSCSTDVPAYDNLIAPSSGKLQARAQPTTTTDPCMVPATAGFRSLENQLYRVEIHNAGTGDASAGAGTATFKWSRDNGSVVASWVSPPSGQPPVPNTLFVSSTGKDSVLGFAPGQWVELSDDQRELNFQPGTLVRLTNVQGQVLTADPATVIPSGGSLNLTDYPLNPKVRRWDSLGATPVTTSAWLDVENGVQVQFAGGTYATGDYWLIPARTLTANIDWPLDSSGNPVSESPKGIQKHFCKLALVQFDGTKWSLLSLCLPIFPPLTSLIDRVIHVTAIQIAAPEKELLNDSEVNIIQVVNEFGINIMTDAAVDPVSTQPTTVFVTVEIPYPLKDLVAGLFATAVSGSAADNKLSVSRSLEAVRANVLNWQNLPLLGFQPMILPGIVTAQTVSSSSTNEISWVPAKSAGDLPVMAFLGLLLELMPPLQPTSRLLTRLTLKGNFIWGLNDPTMYLDGNDFGIKETRGTTHSIGLEFPSGDGKRGGDFEMWFYLVLPVVVTGVKFSPNPVDVSPGATATSTGTLTLLGTQLTAGNTVTLAAQALDANGNRITANIATVPASVTLGTNPNPTFTVTGINLPQGMNTASLQVTPSYGGQAGAPGTLTINSQVGLIGLAFVNVGGAPITTTNGGSTVALKITLSGPAPSGGAAVTLTANPGSVAAATVPSQATVLANSTTTTVNITTVKRTNTFELSVTGTLGTSQTANLSITAG